MAKINKSLLELNPGIVEAVRKEYNLDKPGMMDQAIDVLDQWIQKQEHFLKKDFSREYLERVIISTKGSVEKAKIRVDKMCTLRTAAPELFEKINAKQDLADLSKSYVNVYMPKLTEDNYRVYVIQLKNSITSSLLLDAYRHIMILGEYMKRNDYAKGVIIIMDVRDNNMVDLVAQFNLVEMHNAAMMYMKGYGFRIKNMFIVSPSKHVDLYTCLLRKVLTAKVGERIIVVKTVEDLYDFLPKELLPKDYGGHQKSILELNDEWTEELSSEEHIKYLKEMTKAGTNEQLRQCEGASNEYLGIPGSFKKISVD